MISHSLEDHADALADYMPNGRLFESKNINNSNYRQLLRGVASELFTSEGYLISLNDEYLPDQTALFLDEWESALGIPDGCLSGEGSPTERRRDILVKMALLGVQTATDFERLGDIFGIDIEVHAGIDFSNIFPAIFPFVFFNSAKEARFTIIVDFTIDLPSLFTLTFPFVLGSAEIETLRCLFNKIKPVNCEMIFRQV